MKLLKVSQIFLAIAIAFIAIAVLTLLFGAVFDILIVKQIAFYIGLLGGFGNMIIAVGIALIALVLND